MQFEKQLAFKQLLQSHGFDDINVTDEQAQEYYDQNKKQFETPEQVRASHIFIKPDTTSDPNIKPEQAKADAAQLGEKGRKNRQLQLNQAQQQRKSMIAKAVEQATALAQEQAGELITQAKLKQERMRKKATNAIDHAAGKVMDYLKG